MEAGGGPTGRESGRGDVFAVEIRYFKGLLPHPRFPCRRDECARVKSCGARVLTLDQLEGLKVSGGPSQISVPSPRCPLLPQSQGRT